MTELKRLPPSMRARQRYLVFEAMGAQVGKEEVAKAVFSAGMRFLGENGYSKLKAWVLDFDRERQKGIIRFAHNHKKAIKTVLLLTNEVGGKKVIIHTLGISGTIRKARQKWLG